jgi:hypothetical protein
MKLDIEQRGAGKAAADLRQLGGRASDLRRVSEKVRSVYRASNERRFDTRGRGRWRALDPETLARKQDPRINRDTSALYRSLTSARSAGQIDEREPTEFRFGTEVDYALYVDRGTSYQPARKLIELTPSERKDITTLIGGYIAEEKT